MANAETTQRTRLNKETGLNLSNMIKTSLILSAMFDVQIFCDLVVLYRFKE